MPTRSSPLNTTRFPLLFLGIAALLMGLYYAMPTALVENGIVRVFTVIPSGFLLDWLTPDYRVTTAGTRILSPVASLNVLKGCEGTEALLLLYASMIAMWRPLKATCVGILVGTALIFVLNQIRIVSLYFVAAYHPSYFELIHGFLAPLLIIAFVALFFLYWHDIPLQQFQDTH